MLHSNRLTGELPPGVRFRTRAGILIPMLLSTVLTVPAGIALVLSATTGGTMDFVYVGVAAALALAHLAVSFSVAGKRRTLLVERDTLTFHARGGRQRILRSGARFGSERRGPFTWLTLADPLGEPERVRGIVMRTGRPSKLLVLTTRRGELWLDTGKTWDSDPGALRRAVDDAETLAPEPRARRRPRRGTETAT